MLQLLDPILEPAIVEAPVIKWPIYVIVVLMISALLLLAFVASMDRSISGASSQ